MRDEFKGIKIDAGEHSIVAVGSDIRVDSRRAEAQQALLPLRDAIARAPGLDSKGRAELLSDVSCMETQLAKSEPNRVALQSLWEGIQRAATAAGLVETLTRIGSSIGNLWS